MKYICQKLNPLSANITKWSNTLKQFVGKLPTNCLSVLDHFLELAFKGLKKAAHQNKLKQVPPAAPVPLVLRILPVQNLMFLFITPIHCIANTFLVI